VFDHQVPGATENRRFMDGLADSIPYHAAQATVTLVNDEPRSGPSAWYRFDAISVACHSTNVPALERLGLEPTLSTLTDGLPLGLSKLGLPQQTVLRVITGNDHSDAQVIQHPYSPPELPA
jgi:hypothetical protein